MVATVLRAGRPPSFGAVFSFEGGLRFRETCWVIWIEVVCLARPLGVEFTSGVSSL